MRYVRIILLHFQKILEHKSRSLVWFLIPSLGASWLLLYWTGIIGKTSLDGWTQQSIFTYYFFLMIASVFLISHIEEDVYRRDIQEGQIVKYLVKPISYFWIKFIEELPYRFLQAGYGIIICFIVYVVFKGSFTITDSALMVFLSIFIALLAYFLSQIFKMVLGLLAFWLTDMRGLYEFLDILTVIFAGYLMPLSLLPNAVSAIGYSLPFAYMLYFPIVAFEGKLTIDEALRVITVQLVWIAIFTIFYRYLWNQGMKKFTAVGQ